MATKHLKPWIWQRPDWPEFHWDSARLAQPLAAARGYLWVYLAVSRVNTPNVSDPHRDRLS